MLNRLIQYGNWNALAFAASRDLTSKTTSTLLLGMSVASLTGCRVIKRRRFVRDLIRRQVYRDAIDGLVRLSMRAD